MIERNKPASESETQSASRGELSAGESEEKAAFTEDGTWTGSWDFEWAKSLDAFNEWVAWEWIAGVIFVVTLVASYFLNRGRYALKESLEESEQAWWDGERKIRPDEAEDLE